MDEEIANLDYSDENYSSTLLANYETKKKKLDESMEIWEVSTEELLNME